MTSEEMMIKVKGSLQLEDESRDLMISDVVLAVCEYCNLSPGQIPEMLEPTIRKKVKGIIDYEADNGAGYCAEVASIKEGDGSITWAQTEGNTKVSIYGLNETDRKVLRRYRRLRGYDKSVCSDV